MAWIDRVADTRAQLATLPSRVIEPAEQRYTLDQLAKMFSFDGNGYPFIAAQGSSAYDSFERDEHSFVDYVHSIYKTNGVVFGVVLARMLLFTEARFQFQRLRKGRPGDLFSTPELDVLHKPWPNGTTGELLARAEQDVSISGNFYAVKEAGRLRRLRPDWVQIILTSPPARAIKSDVAGYLYSPGGGVDRNSPEGKIYLPHEICHWSPIPDPEAQYRGMSWLTPVLAEVQADHATTRHKLKFFQNAATPNLAVSFSESVSQAQFKAFMQAMNAAHQGSNNAYKTLYLGGGADVKVIGADLRQLDFKSTQGAGETRICAAGGVPPIIVGLSEGLQSATYSNYGMARRKFGDHWARPQWRSFCAAAESLVRTPSDARLWYDDRDIAFLREDQKDVATIQSQQASTMKQLLDAGYKPESVIAAITNEDWTLLEHTGLFSVQLQPPGGAQAAPGAAPDLGGGAPPVAPEIAPTDTGGGESATPATAPGSEGEATPESVLAEAGINLSQLNAQIQALQRAADRLGPTEAGARVRRVLAAYKVARSKWDEASHPRGPGGKFATKPSGQRIRYPSMSDIDVGDAVELDEGYAQVLSKNENSITVLGAGGESTVGIDDVFATFKGGLAKDDPAATDHGTATGAGNLTEAQRKAVREYTGGRFRDVNELHRHPERARPYDDTRDISDGLDSAFDSLPPLDKPIKVNRRVHDPELLFGAPGSRVGGEFVDDGFISTTSGKSDPFFGTGNIAISVPAGHKAMDVSAASHNARENEVLLPRGTKFKVVRDELDASGTRQIELEVDGYDIR